jgi:long-chain acyl-CoA synthetase
MPVDLVEMKIVDPDTGQQCPAGTPGEIVIRGPNVMLGYWNRADETAAAIRDGWFYSGDIGEVDEQGYFYIVDRLKDMIVVSGLKVFPAEVERVLLDHPAVSEAAVVGFADAVLGEKVAAFIVTAPESNTTAEAIRGHCQAHLGAYKIPGKVVFVDQLPRNPAGKVLKTRLREAELSDLEPSFMQNHESIPAAPTSDSVAARPDLPAVGPLVEKLRATHPASRERLLTTLLQDELRSLTGRADVPDIDEPIINEEIDSLMIVEFRDRLQRQIGTQLQLPATIVFDHPKLSELAVHLLSALEQKEERVGIPPNSSESATPGVLKAGGKAESLQRQTDGPPARQGVRPAGAETASEQIETMSEQQAMEALLREMND